MKALSLWQPWASLWCSPCKRDETRHWPLRYRGPLLVHAAKRFEKDIDAGDPLGIILTAEFGTQWARALPTGVLIGIVHIVDCLRTEDITSAWAPEAVPLAEWENYHCGDFYTGRFAFRRSEHFRRFAQPIPYRGQQGLFDVPDEVVTNA